MILKDATVQLLIIEELFFLLRGRKFKKQSLRATKRDILKNVLDKLQIERTLEPLERILWSAFRYENYKLQTKYARDCFNDLKRRAGSEFREFLKTLENNRA